MGDCDQPFTIQSISKPFTFGMALETYGHAKVAQHVGVEPSGDAFNAINLQSGTNRPHNPMINSGAHVHLRDVRLLRRMGLPGRRTGQERRQRR